MTDARRPVPEDALILTRPDDVPHNVWVEFQAKVSDDLRFLQRLRRADQR